MKKSALLFIALPLAAQANDSTGYLSTGGVAYIKNDKIAMQSEDLFVSQSKIRVAYQYKNLTDQDVTENILFPLPVVKNDMIDGDFADTAGLVESFKIVANGQSITPNVHIRALLYPANAEGIFSEQGEDVTEALKACGLNDKALSALWTNRDEVEAIEQKIIACQDPRLAKFKLKAPISWGSQIIYSWQQTFKANALTAIEHEYKPLVGGSVEIKQAVKSDADLRKTYCLDDHFNQALFAPKKNYQSYNELSYILTTGANWAKPIEDFRLTVERKTGDLVSFCWDGAVKKVFDDGKVVRFEATKKAFVPKQDLDVLFVPNH